MRRLSVPCSSPPGGLSMNDGAIYSASQVYDLCGNLTRTQETGDRQGCEAATGNPAGFFRDPGETAGEIPLTMTERPGCDRRIAYDLRLQQARRARAVDPVMTLPLRRPLFGTARPHEAFGPLQKGLVDAGE